MTETEIDDRIPADLTLPAAVRRWWGWHDGTTAGIWSGDPSAIGVGPWWLPIVHYDGATTFLDLNAAAPDGDAPLHVWSKVPDDVFSVRFESLGDLIGRWASALEEGHFRWSAETAEWTAPDILPADLRRLI